MAAHTASGTRPASCGGSGARWQVQTISSGRGIVDGTSVMFGTDVFVRGVEDFCGARDVVVMLDTNAGMGDFASAEMFLDSSLQGMPATLQPYTCCNDTDYDGGLNRYASDRVMVAGGLEIDALEGGSVAPGGPLPDDLSYTCHSNEEHAPIRAHISTK